MTTFDTVRACLIGDLLRYGRSRGLWILLLLVPIGAKYLVEGTAVHIALDRHLFVMTSAAVGVTIGVVVSTMLIPAGFLYLRSNVTRHRPWQLEDVTPASRIAMVLGHFGADCVVLLASLSVATVAGWILAWRSDQGPLDLIELSRATWLIACPTLICVAALRQLLNALPATRGALGDILAFLCWMATLAMPATVWDSPSSLSVNMRDLPGYTRPIIGEVPLRGQDLAVGGGPVKPGRRILDAEAGLGADGYVESRLVWTGLAVLGALIAGLLNRPAKPRVGRDRFAMLEAWWRRRASRASAASTVPASAARWPTIGLVMAEFELIGRGIVFKVLAFASAVAGLFGDFRHLGSPVGLLVLSFAMSGYAGQGESRGLLALTGTTRTVPILRRGAFVTAGAAWAVLLAVPRAVLDFSAAPLLLAAFTGVAAAFLASSLAAATRSAFTPRMVLLILWYGYFAS